MAYDAGRGVIILFGGYGKGGFSQEAWQWNGTAWTLLASGGPSARNYHAMAHDASRGVTVLYGGQDSNGILNSGTWELQVSCYANCDGSTVSPVLTANDFQCFINKYAAADAYANCDGSTVAPVLTANDFQCFINSYASGYP